MDNGSGGLGSIILFLPLIALVGFMFFGQRKRQREVAAELLQRAHGGVQLRFDRRAVGMKAPVADAPTVQSGE